MARRALLIGNATFDNQEEFSDLRTPVNNVQDFATVLEKYCDFEIAKTVINETAEDIRKAVVDFFHQAERGDLTLLYYSGHGYRDQHDRYYLTARDSQTDNLMISAVRESFVHDVMSESHARHFIIILDCCFSGAFINGQMSGRVAPLSVDELKGEARIVLSSSSKVQYSFEGEEDGRNSLFTLYLIEGITTGHADKDQDSRISIEELFYYAERKVRSVRREESNYLKQTPMIKLGVRECEVFITPHIKKALEERLQTGGAGQEHTLRIVIDGAGEEEFLISVAVEFGGQVQDSIPEIPCLITSEKPWQAIFKSAEDRSKRILFCFRQVLEAVEKQENGYVQILLDIRSDRAKTWEWEQLSLPGDPHPLCIQKNVEFARLLPAFQRETGILNQTRSCKPSVLGVIASDTNLLKSHRLGRLDKPKIRETFNTLFRAENIVGYLMTEDSTEQVTLKKIIEKLNIGRFNILHLRSHSVIPHNEPSENLVPHLLIGAEVSGTNSEAKLVGIDELSQAVNSELYEPLLQVLILDTYHSGEIEKQKDFCTLGCRMTQSSVPAVITLCSRMPSDKRDIFLETFYQELSHESGRAGKAVTEGRRALYVSLQKEKTLYPLPIFYRGGEVNVQFETDLAESRNISFDEGKIWSFPVRSKQYKEDVSHYKERQITNPEIHAEVSEYLLDVINQPHPSCNYLFLHSKPLYGRTATLYRLLYKQLQFFEAGVLDTIPVYIDMASIETDPSGELSSEDQWKRLIKQEIHTFYDNELPDLPEDFLPEMPRRGVFLDNVHTLSRNAIKGLYQFITNSEQHDHFFILACLSSELGNFFAFEPEKQSLELCGFPSLDELPKGHKLSVLRSSASIKEMARCPAIHVEFENIIDTFQQKKESYSHAKLLDRWFRTRTHALLRDPRSETFLERTISTIEELAFATVHQNVFTGFSKQEFEKQLFTKFEDTKIVEQVVEGLQQQNLIYQEEAEPDRYRFRYPILQAFLAARYYAKRINNLPRTEEPPSFFSLCRNKDEILSAMLEFLVEMLQGSELTKTVHEQIIFDAMRAGNSILAARLVNKKRISPEADYRLSQQVQKLVFVNLLDAFASGNEADRRQFIEWMKIENITEQIQQNITVRCSPEAEQTLQDLLTSKEIKDVLVAIRILPWIVDDQSVPLLLRAQVKSRKFYSQILSTHRNWLEKSFIVWLKRLSTEDAAQVRLRFQELVDKGVLSHEVFEIIITLFKEKE